MRDRRRVVHGRMTAQLARSLLIVAGAISGAFYWPVP
jgi:hypothetical protein